MVYSIQDSETGEVDYICADCTTVKLPKYDEETGEPVNDQLKVRYRKHGNFHIPKMYLRGTVCDEFDNTVANRYQSEGITVKSYVGKPINEKRAMPMYESEDYMKMDGVQNDIVLGYNKDNARLFLVPTLFFFNWFLAALLAILEISLHFMAHHKNKLTMNEQFYFRSPLHVLTSQFCAICRTESDSKYNKIFQSLHEQMRHAHRTGALKDLTKAIS